MSIRNLKLAVVHQLKKGPHALLPTSFSLKNKKNPIADILVCLGVVCEITIWNKIMSRETGKYLIYEKNSPFH